MPMNCSLDDRQRELQARARRFAVDVLREARTAENLPTPEERFAATKPAYERMIADGYLRLCIPESVGGDGRSLVDTALVYEELYTENASVALTLLGTMLGLQPLLVGGSADQQKQRCWPRSSRPAAHRWPGSAPASRAAART